MAQEPQIQSAAYQIINSHGVIRFIKIRRKTFQAAVRNSDMMFHTGIFFRVSDPSDGVFRRMLGMARPWIKIYIQVIRR